MKTCLSLLGRWIPMLVLGGTLSALSQNATNSLPERGRGPSEESLQSDGPLPFDPEGSQAAPKPGEKITAKDVVAYRDLETYDPWVLRTLFLEFDEEDWEQELAEAGSPDTVLPARLNVDGLVCDGVGVRFEGLSSLVTDGAGQKRSMVISLDYAHPDQEFGGYHVLDLLVPDGDPSFVRTVLYYGIARQYLPAPQANLVRVVINGESWGVYVSVQHFDEDFIADWAPATTGARWVVRGGAGGGGPLAYLGEEVAPYQHIYHLQTQDDPRSWADLIRLCRVVSQTPTNDLEDELAPLLNIDSTLRYFALENTLINRRGSGTSYDLYEEPSGRFNLIPAEANRAFGGAEGGAGEADGGALEPLPAANDASRKLLSRLLAIPDLRSHYLAYVRDLAGKCLDWNNLGVVADRLHDVIADAVRMDARKTGTTAAFMDSLSVSGGLKSFADQKRAWLLGRLDALQSANQQ